MNFVKSFDIGGVSAAQIPCIRGSGVPTAATEGAVGCLYMDTDTGEMYKCTAANDGVCTWEKFGGSMEPGATGDLPFFEKVGGSEEYNEITKAVNAGAVFNTAEEFMAYEGNAVLNNHVVSSSGVTATDGSASKASCVLKIQVNPGAIIRDKLATFWNAPGYASGVHYLHFYNESNTAILKLTLSWADNNAANYLDIRQNGVIAPEGSAYALITIKDRYKLNSGSEVYGGILANIITVNKEASLTEYDGSSSAPVYEGVRGDGGETYYQAVDDVRIQRYEDMFGDIETALDNIIAVQEDLIGGGTQ